MAQEVAGDLRAGQMRDSYGDEGDGAIEERRGLQADDLVSPAAAPPVRDVVAIGTPPDSHAREAVTGHDWQRLQQLWLEWFQYENLADHPDAIEAYRTIDEEGRFSCPILTLARAMAEATQPDGKVDPEAVRRIVANDAVTVHLHWRNHDDTDAAVLAGISYLAGQLETAAPGRGLTDALSTRDEIDHFIAERRRAGQPPSPAVATLFASRSAQLALASGSPGTAASEVTRGMLMHGTAPPRAVDDIEAVRLLSLELFGTFHHGAEPSAAQSAPTASGTSTAARLARLAAALRLLDHAAADRELADWRPALGERLWSVRLYLQGVRVSLWGDPEVGLAQLDTEVAHNSAYSTEQHEPLGRFALRRVRVLLLSELGASTAALSQAGRIDPPRNWVPLARSALWASRLDDALHYSEQGLYEAETWPGERASLEASRAAALALMRTTPADLVRKRVRIAVDRCTQTHSLIGVAALPEFARRRLLQVHDDLDCDPGCILCDPELRARVQHLDGRSPTGGVAVMLTARERELLPLLAGPRSVPEIARVLHVTVSTVRKQIVTLRLKFDATNREELVRRARLSGHLSSRGQS
ncbi:response regulator transcription factor [Micropruina sp.]|uniref:helix-turn-helix transcriptional regulator n=1 Tax=Micropruina sp. TaxID=2737536 RepID=UPI0039E4C2DA